MLVSDLITEAWLDIDEITVGRLISSAEQADSFARLNAMLDQWSTEELSVYTEAHTGFTVTAGTAAYTLGPSGTLSLASSAVCVTGASSSSAPFAKNIEVVSFPEFHARRENRRGRTTVLAELVAADQHWPLINILLYPTPAASPGTLWLDYWLPLTAFTAVTETVSLPPGYTNALRLNLALELFGPYARHARPGKFEWLVGQAKAAKEAVVALNLQVKRGQAASAAAAMPNLAPKAA
jgi:hypothetical protein